MRQLKREGIIKNDELQTENEISLAEEAFLTIDKVRCYNCHKLGHYSNKCPMKRFKKKQQEVQLVEVLIDAQIITYPAANDDDAKESCITSNMTLKGFL